MQQGHESETLRILAEDRQYRDACDELLTGLIGFSVRVWVWSWGFAAVLLLPAALGRTGYFDAAMLLAGVGFFQLFAAFAIWQFLRIIFLPSSIAHSIYRRLLRD